MKNKLLIILLLNFIVNLSAQTKSDQKVIDKIEREILKKQIKKDSFYSKDDGNIIVYFKNNTPILIRKIIANTRHTYSFAGNKRIERDYKYSTSANFYIKNWNKNEYIRIGEFLIFYKDSISKNIIPRDYIFDFDKIEIENFIAKTSKMKQK